MRAPKLVIIAIVAVAAALFAAPTASAAPICGPSGCVDQSSTLRVSGHPSYKGWGRVDTTTPCAAGNICVMGFPSYAEAYRWERGRWNETWRAAGARVYIWPYAAGWSWTWTSQSGWLAMRTTQLSYVARIAYA